MPNTTLPAPPQTQPAPQGAPPSPTRVPVAPPAPALAPAPPPGYWGDRLTIAVWLGCAFLLACMLLGDLLVSLFRLVP